MALERLIKNSIDTDNHYNSIYQTAIKLYDKALDFAMYDETEENANMLRAGYQVAARELQAALWSEWSLWLEAHNCDLDMFHEALINVLKAGVQDLFTQTA